MVSTECHRHYRVHVICNRLCWCHHIVALHGLSDRTNVARSRYSISRFKGFAAFIACGLFALLNGLIGGWFGGWQTAIHLSSKGPIC
jgi:hypothetical protein